MQTPQCLSGYKQVGPSADWTNSAWMIRGTMDQGIIIFESDNGTFEVIAHEPGEYGSCFTLFEGTAEQCLSWIQTGDPYRKTYAITVLYGRDIVSVRSYPNHSFSELEEIVNNMFFDSVTRDGDKYIYGDFTVTITEVVKGE